MKSDLNHEALIFLKTLYETQNLVNAANQLGYAPATASRMLARLRAIFDDELFTRCAGGLAATWRTTELMPQVRRLLDDYDRLLEANAFDPKRLARNFRIAGVDHGVVFLGGAVARMSEVAPGVSIEMTEITNDWPMQLRTGELDAVISPMETVPEGFHYLTLRDDLKTHFMCRTGHPLLAIAQERANKGERAVVTERELLEYGFVEVTWRPTNYFRLMKSRETALFAMRRVVMRTPYFLGAMKVVASSDLIMHLSNILGDWCITQGFLARIPVEPGLGFKEHPFSPKLIWHDRSHHDPSMQWLRSMVLSAVRKEATLAAACAGVASAIVPEP